MSSFFLKVFVTFNTIEDHLGKESLEAQRINTTGVPVYSA